jgi:hypothetical protein
MRESNENIVILEPINIVILEPINIVILEPIHIVILEPIINELTMRHKV